MSEDKIAIPQLPQRDGVAEAPTVVAQSEIGPTTYAQGQVIKHGHPGAPPPPPQDGGNIAPVVHGQSSPEDAPAEPDEPEADASPRPPTVPKGAKKSLRK